MISDIKYFQFVMRFALVIAVVAIFLILFYAFASEFSRDGDAANEAFQERVLADLGKDGLQSIAVDKPHRGDKELKNWIGAAVSEALTLNPQNLEETYDAVRPYFTQTGFRQYQEYLREAGILNNIQSNNYRMSLFMEQQSLLLNSTSVEGVYRWLYQIPVTLSFTPSNSIRAGRDITNRKVMIRLQIKRVPNDVSEEGMQIESWTVTTRR